MKKKELLYKIALLQRRVENAKSAFESILLECDVDNVEAIRDLVRWYKEKFPTTIIDEMCTDD